MQASSSLFKSKQNVDFDTELKMQQKQTEKLTESSLVRLEGKRDLYETCAQVIATATTLRYMKIYQVYFCDVLKLPSNRRKSQSNSFLR